VSGPLSPATIEELRQLDSCAVANAIETFGVRLRNEGFTDGRIRCLFGDMRPAVGFAVTATVRTSTPPAVGHEYMDRTDWWNYVLTVPAPRIVVVQDVDERPGLGAFVGEVHGNVLAALGCVACVTNGSVRDLPAVRKAGLQMFAGSVSPSHAFAHVVGCGKPVEIAGLTIATGDLLFGDAHGLVTVPADIASQLPSVTAAMRQRERRVIELCQSPDFSIERLRDLVQDLDS
jgi:regulator of RNase E activity RraA